MRRIQIAVASAVLMLAAGLADVRNCACDAARPETLDRRECSLCRAAEAQSEEVRFFAIRDTNPNKPNRWLAGVYKISRIVVTSFACRMVYDQRSV